MRLIAPSVIIQVLLFCVLFGKFGLSVILAQGMEVTAGEPILSTESAELFNQSVMEMEQEIIKGRVEEVVREDVSEYDLAQAIINQIVLVEIYSGSNAGEVVEISYQRILAQGEEPLKMGDRILINKTISQGETYYFVIDYDRANVLLWLLVLFAAVVIAVGRTRGLFSLVGLVVSFAVIFGIILNGIRAGYDPILVALVGAFVIIVTTFYISHGLNEKTHWAVAGTVAALFLTSLLARFFIGEAKLTGFASEEAVFLQVVKEGTLQIRGILLAGIIIGALGVLDDITISQASIVLELRRANRKLSKRELFFRAMRVGQDHISSLANTLVLVYAGGALPMMLLFTMDTNRSWDTILSYEIIAEEVVRTLVASIGLVAAVPITTFLAAYYGFKNV
jgi:uncharacterized membrane protein